MYRNNNVHIDHLYLGVKYLYLHSDTCTTTVWSGPIKNWVKQNVCHYKETWGSFGLSVWSQYNIGQYNLGMH